VGRSGHSDKARLLILSCRDARCRFFIIGAYNKSKVYTPKESNLELGFFLILQIMAVLATDKPAAADVIAVDSSLEDDTYIDHKEERAFVWRLDCIFLVVGFLGYTFKYLDQTNIVSALRITNNIY
jgi:hypothetical protein